MASQDAGPGSNLEDLLKNLRDGVELVAQATRPRVVDSLRLTRGALKSVDSAVAVGIRRLQQQRELSGLYVILDPEHCRGRDPTFVAEKALRGGATIIQWRDKRRDKGDQLPALRALRSLCDRYLALLLVNDHVDLALAARADGTHVGQHDLPVAAVRRMVPPGFIVGCSTNNIGEARQAVDEGADYVAVGRVFPSTTKASTRDASPETVREVRSAVSLPLVAIGGITAENVDQVIEAGADAAAVISAVCEAEDVEQQALIISKRIERLREQASPPSVSASASEPPAAR
jgi:thiamine-phosphate pyrophosphorylase